MGDRVKSVDTAAKQMIDYSNEHGYETVFDRYESQQPQCGFGSMGLCCRNCWKGPCRIDPFGNGPKRGICGADAHTIAARQLARMMAAGGAAHAEHGRHILEAASAIIEGHGNGYHIEDRTKLMATAARLGIETEGREDNDILGDILTKSYEDFHNYDKSKVSNWLTAFLPAARIERLKSLGVMAPSIDTSIAQLMARTSVGCDADPLNIILGGVRAAMSDLTGMAMATELSDILFGTPTPVVTEANLGALREDAVNIALNGHNPIVAEAVTVVAVELEDEAKAAGATGGINLVGVCCTGNESMLRHGIPLAANYLSQEMVIVTGVLDAMVVDVQCVMPGLVPVAEDFHTRVITTMDDNKIPGAEHVSVHAENGFEQARKIVRMAIEAFANRNAAQVFVPDVKETAVVGFSAEVLVDVLSKLNAEDPLAPLLDAIVGGAIKGVVLFAGCNTTQVDQDMNYTTMAKELAKRDVLMLATGCGGGALAKDGFMTSEATEKYAGDGLKAVLTLLGETAGLGAPLPLVLHMGSCVDNSRALTIATALANKIGVDLDKLPVVASAPECMSEKAVSIGSWAVAIGLPVHLGNVPQVMGSSVVVDILTNVAKDAFGGYFIVDTDPVSASEKIFDVILERRAGLGI